MWLGKLTLQSNPFACPGDDSHSYTKLSSPINCFVLPCWSDSLPPAFISQQQFMANRASILVKSIWYILRICYVFIIAPLRWWKRLFFPNSALPPPLHTMLLQGVHFERTAPTLYRREGGGGGGGWGMVKSSTKAKCTITFDQDCW